MTAILFGSISTLADTSELQRSAFNQAFVEHGLDWRWDQEDYRAMLEGNGGSARIADYAASRGESVDADAVHATKSGIFQRSLGEATARPGVVQTISSAKQAGTKLGLVTTTSPENVTALLEALAPEVTTSDFDVVVSAADVTQTKPDPAAYRFALESLSEEAASCVAIEDNPGGVRSAVGAGLRCVAFPNENTADQSFTVDGEPVERVDELSFEHLTDPSAA